MGGILEEMCCINHQDVIFNQNYPNHFNSNSKSIEIQHQRSKKEQKEKLPSNQISLGSTRKENAVNQACEIPISSKDVIIQKSGDPFQEYEILEKLGEGTFGKVFKVKNKSNNCIRAMKQIEKGFIMNINDSEIGKEIEILSKLNHPYIIKLYEYYVKDQKLFLISELCDDGDLQKKNKKNWKIS